MSVTLNFFLPNEQATIMFGRRLAQVSERGDTYALYGTLGMGKSVLARAFIQELTAAAEVPSPTFTLVQSYEAPDFEIYHFDLYRLKKAEEIFEIGVEEALYEGVCLIEWPERMKPYLPHDVIKIEIIPEREGRHLTMSIPDGKHSRLSKLQEETDHA